MFQHFSSASTNFAGRNTLSVAPFSSLYSSCLTLLVGTSSTAAWALPAPRIGIDAAASPSANDSRRVNSTISCFLPLLVIRPASSAVSRRTGPVSQRSHGRGPPPSTALHPLMIAGVEQMHARRIDRDLDGLTWSRCDPLAERADDR